ARMRPEHLALLVDDRPLAGNEAAALQEGTVVVAGEEAGLLAPGTRGDGQPGVCGLEARLRLRLLPEREGDPLQRGGIETREHVRLVLRLVRAPREQQPPTVAHDPRVVTRGERARARPAREREQ